MPEYKATLKRIDSTGNFCSGCALSQTGKNTLCGICLKDSEEGLFYIYEITDTHIANE